TEREALSLEGRQQRPVTDDLHLETAASSPKDSGRRDQLSKSLFLDQSGDGKNHRRLPGRPERWPGTELSEIDPVVDAVHFAAPCRADLIHQIPTVVLPARDHGLAVLDFGPKVLRRRFDVTFI